MVNMVLKRADGSQYDIEGKLYDSVDIDMVIDGYNAPITGKNENFPHKKYIFLVFFIP